MPGRSEFGQCAVDEHHPAIIDHAHLIVEVLHGHQSVTQGDDPVERVARVGHGVPLRWRCDELPHTYVIAATFCRESQNRVSNGLVSEAND